MLFNLSLLIRHPGLRVCQLLRVQVLRGKHSGWTWSGRPDGWNGTDGRKTVYSVSQFTSRQRARVKKEGEHLRSRALVCFRDELHRLHPARGAGGLGDKVRLAFAGETAVGSDRDHHDTFRVARRDVIAPVTDVVDGTAGRRAQVSKRSALAGADRWHVDPAFTVLHEGRFADCCQPHGMNEGDSEAIDLPMGSRDAVHHLDRRGGQRDLSGVVEQEHSFARRPLASANDLEGHGRVREHHVPSHGRETFGDLRASASVQGSPVREVRQEVGFAERSTEVRSTFAGVGVHETVHLHSALVVAQPFVRRIAAQHEAAAHLPKNRDQVDLLQHLLVQRTIPVDHRTVEVR